MTTPTPSRRRPADLVPPLDRKLYSVLEAAGILSCSKSQVYALIARHEIPALRVGKSLRIRVGDLDAYIAAQAAAARAAAQAS
jgi:excisionase family DNA binding protein